MGFWLGGGATVAGAELVEGGALGAELGDSEFLLGETGFGGGFGGVHGLKV